MTEQKTALDFEALRRADEQNDVEALAGFYAEDAEMRLVSKDNPPSSPFELRGREQIAEFLRDVFDRDIESRIENEVLGEDRIAFNVACEYPDGTRVFAATTLEVEDGKICRQVTVETWDE
jgi:nuclear transport factor 2 (NTF2) superfamily protein